ncbi:MAG: hypothetical protein Q8909_17870, partial [Bacteroidota bacterium]|nr:hypothetical protein [Bacteroidota bacterium]
INNSFKQSEFITPPIKASGEKLKLVWFSQVISPGRGLELILPLLRKFEVQLSLTLFGYLSAENKIWLDSFKAPVKVEAPLSQTELHNRISEFDVGLALELSNTDFNRQLCLTNKIYAYAQAGLYILATDTPAQKQFINDNSNRGCVISQDKQSVYEVLNSLITNKQTIRESSIERYREAYQISWEKDSQIWLDQFTWLLNKNENS